MLGVTVTGTGALLARLGIGPAEAWRTLRSRPTMEMVRYAEFRLLGHPTLEAMCLPMLNLVRHHLEREPGSLQSDLGKGRQTAELPPQTYDSTGLPREIVPMAASVGMPLVADRVLTSTEQLRVAVSEARAGEVLELAPGNYSLDQTLVTGRSGTPGRPIVLRARRPGTVRLLVGVTQAFVVSRPYWIFENLEIQGACAQPDNCEHAFHVVGQAVGTVIRNNLITEFNAHIKINGEDGNWPDSGLIQFNTLSNEQPRPTDRPVSLIDLVAASGWRFADNVVKGFVKAGGNGISYGMFMKGGGSGGRIERNLVVCTPHGISQPGLRVGISVGAGGTGSAFCRRGNCASEHSDAVVPNNVVAHCNDVGIDISGSENTLVAHNTLVNTLGVLVRGAGASAVVQGNLLEGSIQARNGGVVARQEHNLILSRMDQALAAPDALDLRWRELPAMLPAHPLVELDFCGRRRPSANPPGATLSADCSSGSQVVPR